MQVLHYIHTRSYKSMCVCIYVYANCTCRYDIYIYIHKYIWSYMSVRTWIFCIHHLLICLHVKYTICPPSLLENGERPRHFSRDVSTLSATLGPSFLGRLHRWPGWGGPRGWDHVWWMGQPTNRYKNEGWYIKKIDDTLFSPNSVLLGVLNAF